MDTNELVQHPVVSTGPKGLVEFVAKERDQIAKKLLCHLRAHLIDEHSRAQLGFWVDDLFFPFPTFDDVYALVKASYERSDPWVKLFVADQNAVTLSITPLMKNDLWGEAIETTKEERLKYSGTGDPWKQVSRAEKVRFLPRVVLWDHTKPERDCKTDGLTWQEFFTQTKKHTATGHGYSVGISTVFPTGFSGRVSRETYMTVLQQLINKGWSGLIFADIFATTHELFLQENVKIPLWGAGLIQYKKDEGCCVFSTHCAVNSTWHSKDPDRSYVIYNHGDVLFDPNYNTVEFSQIPMVFRL